MVASVVYCIRITNECKIMKRRRSVGVGDWRHARTEKARGQRTEEEECSASQRDSLLGKLLLVLLRESTCVRVVVFLTSKKRPRTLVNI